MTGVHSRVVGWVVAALLLAPAVGWAQASAPAPAAPPTNDDCMMCHSDATTTRANGTPVVVDPAVFGASVHKDVGCVDCHADTASGELPHPESLARVDCTMCHDGEAWTMSAHGQAFAAGHSNAPTCKTCHGTHNVVRLDPEVRKYDVIAECGTCHTDRLATYRDTFHGQVTNLGFARIATCADCHTAHAVLPASDPRSTVSPQRRLATCQTCHPSANENFARYQPHADKHDRASNPPLYFTARFMEILLVGVFSFFGLHTTLWFRRSWVERQRRPDPGPLAVPGETVAAPDSVDAVAGAPASAPSDDAARRDAPPPTGKPSQETRS